MPIFTFGFFSKLHLNSQRDLLSISKFQPIDTSKPKILKLTHVLVQVLNPTEKKFVMDPSKKSLISEAMDVIPLISERHF